MSGTEWNPSLPCDIRTQRPFRYFMFFTGIDLFSEPIVLRTFRPRLRLGLRVRLRGGLGGKKIRVVDKRLLLGQFRAA